MFTWYLLVELKGISATLGFLALMSRTLPEYSSMHFSRADSDASPAVSLWGNTQDHISAVTHIRILKNDSRFMFMAKRRRKTFYSVLFNGINETPLKTLLIYIMVLINNAGSEATSTTMIWPQACFQSYRKAIKTQNLVLKIQTKQ